MSNFEGAQLKNRKRITMSEKTVKVGNRTYNLGGILGVGGFSEVCKGVDTETRKRVALKIMYSDKKQSSSEMKQQLIQVQKEIKAMKQLSHVNLIRLLGYDLKCEVKGRKAIVMVQQLAPKGELFDYLMYTKKFEEPQANALFKQLIAGLQAMHEAGIAHRDLKPENVLFDNSFNLKLADFGFAYVFQKGEGAKTSMRTELGTKGYMAPEIIANKKYTEKADIFSAGVILFIMLAGFPPFQNAVAKDWWFDKLIKGKYKLFWMAHERTAKFSTNAKDILQKMLYPKEAKRLDVYGLKETDFWNAKCLTKDELVACLKKRKKVVDEEKAKDPEASRDTLLEILIPEGDLLPNSDPVLLSSLLDNKFLQTLRKTEDAGSLAHVLKSITDKVAAKADLEDAVKNLDAAKAKKVATTLAENARLTPKELIKTLNAEDVELNEKLADMVSEALRQSQIGVIDDYEIVEKFAKLDEKAVIPLYEIYKTKANSYRTKISFGLLGYCLQKFMVGRGKMQVQPGKGLMQLIYNIQKKVVLPKENKKGEITWHQGAIPVGIHVNVQLSYDAAEKINVLTFENASKGSMGMQEYAAIVKEVTENHNWLLRYFLEGAFETSDENLADTIIPDDFVMEDGDLEETGEEDVKSA